MWNWQSRSTCPLHAIEQVALKLLHFAATQASHVHVVALRTPFVEVPFPLHMQQVEFVHESLALQQRQRPVHGNAINVGVDPGGLAQDLRGVEVLLGGFDDFQNDAALARHANPAA